jgi:vitamin B12 transporter
MLSSGFRNSLFLLFLLHCSLASADRLQVTILDPRSAVVAGARVTLYRESEDRVIAVAATSSAGMAEFDHVQSGDYHVQVLGAGFAPKDTTVNVSGDLAIALTLSVAPAADEVVVTAEGTPVPLQLTASAVVTLEQEQLQLSQPISAADALRLLPGAVLGATGQRGALTSLFVRGGESRFNKVLVDGVPANDSDSFFNFGVVPMFEVDRVELLRGPDSALYGSDAMTSVVRFESAPGRTRIPELLFGADGGNFTTAHGFASLAGARRGFDYKVFSDQFNTAGEGVNNDYSNALQGANIGFALAPRAWLRVRMRHSNSRSGVSSEWNFNGQTLLPPDHDQFARQNDLLGSTDLEIEAPGRWQHSFRGYEYNHRLFSQDLVADRGCDFVSVFFDCPFKTFSAFNRAGFEYQGEYTERTWSRTVLGYSFEDEHGDLRDLLFGGITHGLRRNHDVYVEQIFTSARGSLAGGLRYVHNESFGDRAVPRLAGTVVLARRDGFFSETRLRSAFSQGIKAPDFLESFGNPSFLIRPNPNLRAEENFSVEAGLQQNFARGWSTTATYFHNSFRNEIAFNSLGPPTFQGIFVNLNKALAHGGELEVSGHVRKVMVRGAYFYTSTEVLEAPLDPASVGQPLLRRPKHSGLLQFFYATRRWGGSLNGSFVGRRPDSDFLGFGIDHAAGYARVDVGGWYEIRRAVTAYLNIENLLDKHYNDVVGYPALGTSFRAGFRFRVGGE